MTASTNSLVSLHLFSNFKIWFVQKIFFCDFSWQEFYYALEGGSFSPPYLSTCFRRWHKWKNPEFPGERDCTCWPWTGARLPGQGCKLGRLASRSQLSSASAFPSTRSPFSDMDQTNKRIMGGGSIRFQFGAILCCDVHPMYLFSSWWCHHISGFLLILLLETFAGKCLGGGRKLKGGKKKKAKKKFDDDGNKEEKQMAKTPDTVQMVERSVDGDISSPLKHKIR